MIQGPGLRSSGSAVPLPAYVSGAVRLRTTQTPPVPPVKALGALSQMSGAPERADISTRGTTPMCLLEGHLHLDVSSRLPDARDTLSVKTNSNLPGATVDLDEGLGCHG